MQFKKLENKIVENVMRYGKRHNIKIDKEFALAKLFEEVGEFSEALLIYKQKCRQVKKLSDKKAK